MNYEFDFSKVTLGDLRKLMSSMGDPGDYIMFIEFVDKVTVGGIMHLPVNQSRDVLEKAGAAFHEWTREVNGVADSESWSEMLRDIKGL